MHYIWPVYCYLLLGVTIWTIASMSNVAHGPLVFFCFVFFFMFQAYVCMYMFLKSLLYMFFNVWIDFIKTLWGLARSNLLMTIHEQKCKYIKTENKKHHKYWWMHMNLTVPKSAPGCLITFTKYAEWFPEHTKY